MSLFGLADWAVGDGGAIDIEHALSYNSGTSVLSPMGPLPNHSAHQAHSAMPMLDWPDDFH